MNVRTLLHCIYIKLLSKLNVAEVESLGAKTRISHKDLMAKMRAKINE